MIKQNKQFIVLLRCNFLLRSNNYPEQNKQLEWTTRSQGL